MSLYHNSKQKIRNITRSIDVLMDGDFPLNSGVKALQKLRSVFEDLERKIERAEKIKDIAAGRQLSYLLNLKIYQILPILGFILRSTNVRNSFELLEPLQTITDSVLQGKPQLLLSSEWEYVPFAYPQSLDDLKSFVLIGMPASEAASALLLPLAGHELGHAVWRNRGIGAGVLAALQERCKKKYDDKIDDFRKHYPKYNQNDIEYRELFPESIAASVDIALFQSEELFCDMFAYAVFGESYVYAFSYILAPGSERNVNTKYPSNSTRLNIIHDIAIAEGVNIPNSESLEFRANKVDSARKDRFVYRISEEIVTEIVPRLWSIVVELITIGNILRPSITMRQKHLKEYQMGIPPSDPVSLGDIVNAGWHRYLQLIGERIPEADIAKKIDHLNEMILKTVEVLEFRHRTA